MSEPSKGCLWCITSHNRGLAANLPVIDVDPEIFQEWREYGWGEELTLGDIAEHMKRVQEVDLRYPVIVSADGHVMDGCHRLVRAWLDGVPVKVARFTETPLHDRVVASSSDIVCPKCLSAFKDTILAMKVKDTSLGVRVLNALYHNPKNWPPRGIVRE